MLNLGFGEILILSLLALVVVGPERLPTMIRFMGRQYGKLLRASRELRRAFYMEAERVESDARREEMKKARAKAAERQKQLIEQQKNNLDIPIGVSQDQIEHHPHQTDPEAHDSVPDIDTDQTTTQPPTEETVDRFIPFDHEPNNAKPYIPIDHDVETDDESG